jgi:hypothetical protein
MEAKEPRKEPIENRGSGRAKPSIWKCTIAIACLFIFFLCCGAIDVSDEKMLDLYLNKIEQVANYKMSDEQRKEIHDFCKANLFPNEVFCTAKGDKPTLKDILTNKNSDLKFVTYPTIFPVTGSLSSHQANFKRIKKEFIKQSPTKIPSDTEWAFIFHCRKNEFSDAICKWWNIVPAPPIKLWNKTAFIFYDCFQNQSPFHSLRILSRIIYKYLIPIISRWNYIKNSLMRI